MKTLKKPSVGFFLIAVLFSLLFVLNMPTYAQAISQAVIAVEVPLLPSCIAPQPSPICIYPSDIDADGISNTIDNCLDISNADQLDSDKDGFGNRCDGDLNNDFEVNGRDLLIFTAKLATNDPVADFNGDGSVNRLDLDMLKKQFYLKPPSIGNRPEAVAIAAVQAIENTLKQIEEEGILTFRNSERLNSLSCTIGANMMQASVNSFLLPISDTSVRNMFSVENTLLVIYPQLEQASIEREEINIRLITGEYSFDREYIANMDVIERGNLLNQMTPDARERLNSKFPDLFSQCFVKESNKLFMASAPFSKHGLITKVGTKIMDFFIPKAEAKYSETCYRSCSQNVSSANCQACIVNGSAAIKNAWKTFSKSCGDDFQLQMFLSVLK